MVIDLSKNVVFTGLEVSQLHEKYVDEPVYIKVFIKCLVMRG